MTTLHNVSEIEEIGTEPDHHIHVQLKKAADSSAHEVKGREGFKTKDGADVKFDSSTQFVKSEVAVKVLKALENLKPSDREKIHSHIGVSAQNLNAIYKLIT